MKASASPAQKKEGKMEEPDEKWMKTRSQPCNLLLRYNNLLLFGNHVVVLD